MKRIHILEDNMLIPCIGGCRCVSLFGPPPILTLRFFLGAPRGGLFQRIGSSPIDGGGGH